MKEILINYSTIIIFLHIFSAIIWIGGMIAIRVAVHPVLQSFEDNVLKLGTTLRIVGRLFNLVIPFIIFLILTAIIFETVFGIKSNLVHIKEAIWTIMTINFIIMYIKRSKAQKLFNNGKIADARDMVAIIPKALLPINIALGVLATVLGVVLRGF